MKSIENYEFVDCLLVDFSVDKLVSTLSLVVEAYYSDSEHSLKKKGLLKFLFNRISKVSIIKNGEFDFDINKCYDKAGNDTKANEVYSIKILNIDSGTQIVKVDTDMLKMEVEYMETFIIEIESIGL